jgi:uncharacterized membrane protein
MKSMTARLLIALMVFIIPSRGTTSTNQTSKKILVFLDRSGDDTAGNVFTLSLKDAITRSAGYTLDKSSPTEDGKFIHISVVTVKESDGSASAISLLGTRPKAACMEIFIHEVLSIGTHKAEESGREALADIDTHYSR